MNFSCDKMSFLSGLISVQKATTTNTSFPILETIFIKANEDSITLIGNNLEISIECNVPAIVYQAGNIAVNAKIICEIVRSLPEGNVIFLLDKEFNVTLKCSEANFNIIGLSGEDFPDTPVINNAININIKAEKLLNLIKQTSFAVSKNDIKPVLTGTKFEVKKSLINAIALDGYRLALTTEIIDEQDNEFTCVIPGRSLNELSKIITDPSEDVIINITDKYAMFEFLDFKFITRLLEGEFINYQAIIPKESKFKIKINTNDFIKCIERAALIAETTEGDKTPIKLIFDTNKMTASCISSKGTVKDSIFTESNEIASFEIGFNHRFLLEAMRSTYCEDVILEFTGNINPAVIKPAEGNNFTFIILPVRLRG